MAKRLQRTARGSVVLPSGQKITLSEQKALRCAVNSANRRAKRIISQRDPELVKTKYNQFSEASDWAVKKKSTKLSRFKNKSEFNRYLRSVQKVASGKYEEKRDKIHFENYKKAIRKTFNSGGRDLIKLIEQVGYKKLSNEIRKGTIEAEVGYVYSPEALKGKHDSIASVLKKVV